MLYAIIATDVIDSGPLRASARDAHLVRLRALLDEGRLLVAGPHPAIDSPDPGPSGFNGSLIIAEFPSLADARAWAADDPYVAAGVYANVDIKPFKQALP